MDTINFISTGEFPPDFFPTLNCVLLSFVTCAALTTIQPKSWDMETRSRVTSTIHAIVSSCLAVLSIRAVLDAVGYEGLFPDHYPEYKGPSDVLWTLHVPIARVSVSVTYGYILFDSVLGLLFPTLFDKPMAIHHLIVVISYGAGLLYNFGIPYMAMFLINEASTPFVNNHFIFKKKWNDWRKPLNGAMMWLSYLFCRMIINTIFGYSLYSTVRPSTFHERPIVICIFLIVFITGQALNTNWFYRISRGLLKEITILLSGAPRDRKHVAPQPAADATAHSSPDSGSTGNHHLTQLESLSPTPPDSVTKRKPAKSE